MVIVWVVNQFCDEECAHTAHVWDLYADASYFNSNCRLRN